MEANLKKFLRKTVLFLVIPFLLLFALAEFLLRQIPNDYRFKNNWLKENASDLKVISFGASNGYFGIDPEYFSQKAFNAAHLSQSLKYDHFILNKFLPACDSLRYVILPVSDISLFYSLESTEESWRIKNYSFSYGCRYHPLDLKYNLAFYGSNFYSMIPRITRYYFKGINEVYCNQYGFGLKYSHDVKPKDWENQGVISAKRHHSMSKKNYFDENLNYLNQIIAECNEKNVTVVLLFIPTWHTYTENIDPKMLDLSFTTFSRLASGNKNVTYINLMADPRFIAGDFYDGDHLTEIGAKKLTGILNDTLCLDRTILK